MNEAGQLVIFEAENGPVQVRLEGETVWPPSVTIDVRSVDLEI